MDTILNGKKYDFEIKGTVGIIWIARNFANHEIDITSNSDLMYLLYAVHYTSNKQPLELTEFVACINSKLYNEMIAYFKRRFDELEGVSEKASEGKEDESKKD